MISDKFEELSRNIWADLPTAKRCKIAYGEETITDVMLLELARQNYFSLSIIQTPKKKELLLGTDWEWYIGSDDFGWIRYIIQAKKLSQIDFTYKSLAYPIVHPDPNILFQHQALRQYAKDTNAIPLYNFYNFYNNVTSSDWHCNLSLDIEQLGWSFTPLKNVEDTLKVVKMNRKRGYNSFATIHNYEETLPIRCLFLCPAFRMLYQDAISALAPRAIRTMLGESFQKIDRLPQQLSIARETGVLESFPQELYPLTLAMYPKRIAVFDISQEPDALDLNRPFKEPIHSDTH